MGGLRFSIQGGEDYSQYGYQPEYEMQDENSFSEQAKLDEWRLQRFVRYISLSFL